MIQYTFLVKPLGDRGYMAFCPAMKPVSVFAKTEEEVIKKVDIAVKMYVHRHPDILGTLRSSNLGDDFGTDSL